MPTKQAKICNSIANPSCGFLVISDKKMKAYIFRPTWTDTYRTVEQEARVGTGIYAPGGAMHVAADIATEARTQALNQYRTTWENLILPTARDGIRPQAAGRDHTEPQHRTTGIFDYEQFPVNYRRTGTRQHARPFLEWLDEMARNLRGVQGNNHDDLIDTQAYVNDLYGDMLRHNQQMQANPLTMFANRHPQIQREAAQTEVHAEGFDPARNQQPINHIYGRRANYVIIDDFQPTMTVQP